MVYKWLQKARSVLFPPHCRLCLAAGADDRELCAACLAELPWLGQTCQRCALPLPGDTTPGLCPDCLTSPPVLDACHALFSYQPPVDRWIHALKFGRDLAAARLLGQLLADRLSPADTGKAASLLPVPLHPRRLRERGYNQALEIARPLLGRGWSLSRCTCRRQRHTAAQAGLPARHRLQNLSGAFSADGRLDGQHIVLIDDVMTTGATLNAVAAALKKGGARRVDAWVIARALKQRQVK
jgi:ComF family protein